MSRRYLAVQRQNPGRNIDLATVITNDINPFSFMHLQIRYALTANVKRSAIRTLLYDKVLNLSRPLKQVYHFYGLNSTYLTDMQMS